MNVHFNDSPSNWNVFYKARDFCLLHQNSVQIVEDIFTKEMQKFKSEMYGV